MPFARSNRPGPAPMPLRLALLLAPALLLAGCATGSRDDASPAPAPRPATPAEPAPAPADAAPEPEPVVEPEYVEEIERLTASPRVQAAFREIERLAPRTREDHIRLNEIPAPPFAEEERARVYLRMLREAGADTAWIDDEGNAIAVRRGEVGEETLVLSGHLDTVFPEGTDVEVEVRGDTLFAPGIGDDARGLVVVLTVLRAMNRAGIETADDVWFVGTVGEEGLGDLRGVKHLFREGGPDIDAFLSVDGGGDTRVTHKALGSRRYRVTVEGPGGHSWGAFGTANPAHALGRGIRLFDERAAEFVATGPRTSYNVGVIGGGTSINSVPFEAWMEVDMRSLSPERLMEIDRLFRAAVAEGVREENRARTRGDSLTLDPVLVGDRPSGEVPLATPLVQRAMAAIGHFGYEPNLGRSSTDSNIPIARGIPALTIGGGGEGSGAHSLDEWWLAGDDADDAIKRTLLLVVAEAGLAP